MKVYNPIYDTIFKFLMEDIEIARELISLIIEEEVEELIPAPNEQTATQMKLKYNQLPLQRLDYVAVIKTENKDGFGNYHKVSIEVQKSPFAPELGRFRKYVSEKYARKSTYKPDSGKAESEYLPLKTIYFVDKSFNPDLPAVLRRKGDYWDVLNRQAYTGDKDRFVELLNHDSWFIQIESLPPDLQNDLLYVLSIFAPWVRDAEDERYINVPHIEKSFAKYELLSKIIRRLKLAGKSREVEAALEMEISLESYIEENQRKAEEEYLKRVQAQKEKAEAEKREKEAMKILARKMIKYGEPLEEIKKDTGLSEDEINEL